MTPGGDRPYSARLAIRFAIILALALLPGGIVGIIQTNALEDEIQARNDAVLLGTTLQAATGETGVIRRLRGMMKALAEAIPLVVDDPAACEALVSRIPADEPGVQVVAFIPTSGVMTCSSTGKRFDFKGNDNFERTNAAQAPMFTVAEKGPISGVSVLGISHPVFDASGTYLGYIGLSVSHVSLAVVRTEAQSVASDSTTLPVVFWTFDRNGTILTANIEREQAERQLPSGRALKDFVGAEQSVFRATSASGQLLTYAVVPIVLGELYVMGSFLPSAPGTSGRLDALIHLPTLLMWLVGLIVSGFAAEVLVARHVRILNRSILSFAHGDRRLQAIDLKNAPAELDELASAYLAMTESITRSEAEIEDSVHQKEVLLREVHHRVKNNLQLISSIMNIQIRSARSDEARELLKNLQERIMSLATVHRGLYQTSGLADIRARELIPDIVRQILSMSSGPEKPFETQNEIDDLRLVPDQAVPLSLLLAEALTNAIKHAGATRDHPGRLKVRLKRSGGSDAVLEVINSTRKRDAAAPGTGLPDTGIGSQLITAFVQQLGGRQEFGEADGEYSLRVLFEVLPLSLAENRRVPTVAGETAWNASSS